MIPFSPPRIDQKIIDEVTNALKSGWITTGPRTKLFEQRISEYCGCAVTVAVNSWTMGMQVLLHWWGIKPGDEVIVPAYTYCASANVIVHAGAKPVFVDINEEDFNINPQKVKEAITPRTKAIIAVDIAGYPCDYEQLYEVILQQQSIFTPNSPQQQKLNRILLISDAAHSFGAHLNGKITGSMSDITGLSFHAVKNLTTAEGGALCFNLPEPFKHDDIYKHFCKLILHGQSKDALAKTQKGNWRYDVEEPGFKCNMTDIQASMGLVEIERYNENMERRKHIFELYNQAFSQEKWAIIPKYKDKNKETCYHLYLLRIHDITEQERDAIMHEIFEQDVTVNVHFQPLPLLTAYKKRGYRMEDYPQSWEKYANEISLPVYFNLTDEDVKIVINAVKKSYNIVKSNKK